MRKFSKGKATVEIVGPEVESDPQVTLKITALRSTWNKVRELLADDGLINVDTTNLWDMLDDALNTL